MKRFIMAILLIVFFAIPCIAADLEVKFPAVTGADGYKIYVATAANINPTTSATFNAPIDTGSLTPDGNGDVTYIISGVTDTGLVIALYTAYIGQFESAPKPVGVWYWGDLQLAPDAGLNFAVSGITE